MARLIELKIGLGAALALALMLLLVGPGCGGQDEERVRARNLLTGEIDSFPADEVPADWVVCTTIDCPVPPTVPCQQLSDAVCTLNPSCRLKELWCTGTAVSGGPDDGTDDTTPPAPVEPPTCQYECIPKLPLLCEELTGEQQCLARSDCEWAQGPCPAMPCSSDAPCPPCPYACRAKAPAICQSITDKQQCLARPDCQWDEVLLEMYPPVTKGTCTPKMPVPPPCPSLPAPPPGYCSGGTIVYDKDAAGCVVGYHCDKPSAGCWALNSDYINALKQAKACSPFIMTPVQQCSKLVDSALFCPVCSTFVNPANTAAVSALTTIKQKWLAQGCDQLEVACPAIACQAATSATCLPDASGSSGGTCVDDMPAP